MVKKIFLPWLWTACLLMLSANPAMSRSGFVADAPNGAPAAANLRPAYFLQLKGLQERLVQDVPAAVLQHTVMPGESLTAIAATYGVSVATLAVANNLENPNLIYPGQVLSIPVASTAGNDAPALVHEVKRGDTV
ncbi:MAG TPA: LysM peptidoglycan-binding domain-containing protein, partial [Firmicutes bacterium]|nr:LysM peptidoglycan-binding domain-containing protein [Bacillota bacterium]